MNSRLVLSKINISKCQTDSVNQVRYFLSSKTLIVDINEIIVFPFNRKFHNFIVWNNWYSKQWLNRFGCKWHIKSIICNTSWKRILSCMILYICIGVRCHLIQIIQLWVLNWFYGKPHRIRVLRYAFDLFWRLNKFI